MTGIEPAWPAWKAGALPLSYTRASRYETRRSLGHPVNVERWRRRSTTRLVVTRSSSDSSTNFYAEVEKDELLRPMYPEDLTESKRHFEMFLEQYWGGPQTTPPNAGTRGCGCVTRPFASIAPPVTRGSPRCRPPSSVNARPERRAVDRASRITSIWPPTRCETSKRVHTTFTGNVVISASKSPYA